MRRGGSAWVTSALMVAGMAVTAPSAAALSRLWSPTAPILQPDGHGLPEVSVSGAAGGRCACNCPVLRGVSDARAAGQHVTVTGATVLVVCGTRVASTIDPNPPPASLEPAADVSVTLDRSG